MMTAKGLAKLTEELGELGQVTGKMLAFGPGQHPDGTDSLIEKFIEEAGDVFAAIHFVASTHDVDMNAIVTRARSKLEKLNMWHADESLRTSPYFFDACQEINDA